MKAGFNLAERYLVSPNLARRWLVGLLVLLGLLLAAQGMVLVSVKTANNRLRPMVLAPSEAGDIKPPSEARLKAQEGRVAFANEILRQDTFQWSVLLDRLEQTLVEGVALESVGPEPRDGSVKLVGRALKIENLRDYLGGLSRSEWFSQAFLLEQTTTEAKGAGETSFIRFVIEVKEAF